MSIVRVLWHVVFKLLFVDGDKFGLKKAKSNDTINPMVIDITKSFVEKNSVGGRVVFERNYDKRTHPEEIKIAEWLEQSFGGNVVLLPEIKAKNIRTPDCIWDGRDWEFKTISSDKYGTIDSRIHKAYKQISDNLGGMVLDFTDSPLALDEAVEMVNRSLATRGKDNFLVIVKKNDRFNVLKITKE